LNVPVTASVLSVINDGEFLPGQRVMLPLKTRLTPVRLTLPTTLSCWYCGIHRRALLAMPDSRRI